MLTMKMVAICKRIIFGVIGYSSKEDGTGKDTKNPNKLKHLTKDAADTASLVIISPPTNSKVNHIA